MAIRASDRVTLAVLPTPTSVTMYYLLQASTLAAPGKPTTSTPPAPWTTTEPTYTEGSTDTLYTVMRTAWGATAFEYGGVQKSSAYEAAKIAYNKAKAAEDAAGDSLTAANLAQAAATSSVVPSLTDPGHQKGRIWLVLNAAGQTTSIKVSDGSAWTSYAFVADTFLATGSVTIGALAPSITTDITDQIDRAVSDTKEAVLGEVTPSIQEVAELANTIAETYTPQETFDSLNTAVESLGTELGTTSATADSAAEMAAAAQADLDEYRTTTQKFVTIDPDSIRLGDTASKFSVKITNTELGFYEDDTPVAYVNGQAIKITDMELLNTLRFGSSTQEDGTTPTTVGGYMFVPRAGGGLTLKFVEP